MHELKKIKEDMDVSDLTILNVCDTRWLSWSNNFHQIIEPIQEALQIYLIQLISHMMR